MKIPDNIFLFRVIIVILWSNSNLNEHKNIQERKRTKSAGLRREDILSINDVDFSGLYPMLEVTNKHVSYYCPDIQGNKFIFPPFVVRSIETT